MALATGASRGERPLPGTAFHPGHGRAPAVALAAGIVLGTLAGVVVTTALALVLSAPRLIATGLEPRPESASFRWLVSPEVAGPVSEALLWLLGVTTLLLAALVAARVRRVWQWRAYAAWAVVGGVLTTYALVANWELAREAGLLAVAVGGIWSGAVALGIARTHSWTATRAPGPSPSAR